MKKRIFMVMFVCLFTAQITAFATEQWNSTKVYSQAGNIVEYNGTTYKNYWWTQGDSPAGYSSNKWHVWRPTAEIVDPTPDPDPEPTPDPTPDNDSTWNASKVYADAGTVVYHNGKNWKNHWWTQGDEPGTGGEWAVWRQVTENPDDPEDPTPDPDVPTPNTDAVISARIPVNTYSNTFAPYTDILLWPTPSINTAYANTDQKLYTLAFITANSEGLPYWGGVQAIENTDGTVFYSGEINAIRESGGDVIVSFGGANGTPLAEKFSDADKLAEAYQYVIDTYKLTWVDFDIEGLWVAKPESIKLRSQAIKILQNNNPDLKVAFCLPVLPSGLTADGINVLKSAIEYNVRIDVVNIMAMDFGDSAAPPQIPMGTHIINSAESLYSQLFDLFPEKTSDELWQMIGVTPMIGINDVQSEIVTLSDMNTVLNFAIEKDLRPTFILECYKRLSE